MSVTYLEKPEILSRIPLDTHAVIEASAGTGKTFTLEHLIVELVLSGVRIESILVVTFTEKATAELRARVRAKLAEMIERAGGELPEGADPARYWRLDEGARKKLKDALQRFDAATVSTIHAFCQKVLTEHAFLNQRLFGEQQVDQRRAFTMTFKDVLRRDLARAEPLASYLRAWLFDGGTLPDLEELLFECHDSGAQRLRPDYDHDALSAAVLGFERPKIEPILAELKAAGARSVTIDAVKDRLLLVLPIIEAARESGDIGKFALLADRLEAKKPSFSFLVEKLASLPEGSLARSVLAKLEPICASLVPFEAAIVALFLPLVRRVLEEDKRRRGVFDFDDMLSLLDRALGSVHGELLLAAMRERYRVALIDEFQDTDPVQWNIFRRVFFEGPKQRLYVIGDPKQAIYGFRGADVHTYLRAKDELATRGKIVSLTENHRSTEPLIEAYNTILDQGSEPAFFTGRIRYDAPVTCGRRSLSLREADGSARPPIRLWHVAPAQGQKLYAPEIHRTLLGRLVEEIQALISESSAPLFGDERAEKAEDRPRRIGPGDIHILTRSGKDGIRVGDALRQAGVPHAFFKQDGLYQTHEARAIRDLLLGVEDPSNRSRRLRAWLTPFFELRLEELATLDDVPAAHPLMRRLYEWKALADGKDYARLFTRILEESGIARRELFVGESERALTNYLHLFELLLESAGRKPPTLGELVAHLDALIEARELPVGENGNVQRLESERDAVQIMTIHKSKGLEAPIVFLYGGFHRFSNDDLPLVHHDDGALVGELTVKKRLPSQVQKAIDEEALEEDQRLYYVALTRAKARLYLPYFAGGGGISGAYRLLDKRLHKVAQAIDPRLFEVEPVRYKRIELVRETDEASELRAIEGWSPPEVLLKDAADEERLRELKKQNAGFTITSYSRMKAQAADADDVVAEADPDLQLEIGPDDLPVGTATGVFIHEMLERVSIASFVGAPELDSWRATKEIVELIGSGLLQHNLDPRHQKHAARLVFSAYMTPIDLGPRHLAGIARADRIVREMEFLYPIPERAHPRLEELRQKVPLEIDRGYIKGFVDLAFEHDGRTYFGDWKSDLLPRWDRAQLVEHIDRSYRLQIKLYSLAFVKLLGIRDHAAYERRFGGFLYCFLRAMADGPEGVLFERPSWQDILRWEDELVRGDVASSGRSPDAMAQTRFPFLLEEPDEPKRPRKRGKR
jgi:exodeoxyribonuclease V beta subunit